MGARGPRHPVVVAATDGQVVGWGSLNAFNPRPAYDNVVDLSVYVERAWRGRGVGKALLQHVLGLARQIGYHKMVLATFPYNDAGLALYRRMGFSPVGVYHEQGQLDGRWVDVLIMDRSSHAGASSRRSPSPRRSPGVLDAGERAVAARWWRGRPRGAGARRRPGA